MDGQGCLLGQVEWERSSQVGYLIKTSKREVRGKVSVTNSVTNENFCKKNIICVFEGIEI